MRLHSQVMQVNAAQEMEQLEVLVGPLVSEVRQSFDEGTQLTTR